MESLTDEVERLAWEYIERIDAMGGAVAAIEAGFQMDEIEQAAYEYTKSIDDGERVIVGVNRFRWTTSAEPDILSIDPALQAGQIGSAGPLQGRPGLGRCRPVTWRTCAPRPGARTTCSRPMRAALAAHCTLGEVSDALRDVFGVYHPGR